MRGLRSSWLFFLAVGLVACGTPEAPTGTLSIAITGLPTGAAAAVQVTGPGGYAETVPTTRVLTGLTPGTYDLAAATVDDGHPIVPAVFEPTVVTSTVDVAANGTAVAAVTHAWRTPTGRLYASLYDDGGGVLVGFDAQQLSAGGVTAPALSLGYEPRSWNGMAFDAAGNVWVARNAPDGAIFRFPASDLGASGVRVPDVIITSSAPDVLDGPYGLAFDASGALWVSGLNSDTVVKYAQEQLVASGAPSPQVVVRNASADLVAPAGLAFDGSGALWVANLSGASAVKYSPAQLASSGSPTPAVKISANAGSLQGPLGLAFDRHGHLWVAAAFGQRVVRYDAEQLLVSGSPAPSVTVTGFAQAKGIAFDHAGDLWVNAILAPAERSLVRIADPDSLPTTSVVTASTAVRLGVETDGGFPTFFPTPPDLPIHTP